MESNVSRTVSSAEEPHLLVQARPFEGLPYLDGIGFLFDRGIFFELRYDGCDHTREFLRSRMSFAQAAAWVRAEMASCETCARQARVFGVEHDAR